MQKLVLAAFALFCATQAFSQTAEVVPECLEQIPCQLGERSYHIKAPDDWDGVTPLPVMLHFHGWGRQGTLIVKHGRISGATRKRGVLLLAPNGRGKTWDFWDSDSADTDFAWDVIEDAAKRFPIDRSKIFVSGYSYGSAMAWRMACDRGQGIHALLAVSGTLRQSEVCETAPENIRHVHGTSDTVMGFPFGPGGDETYPVQLWRDLKGCAEKTELGFYNTTQKDRFRRTEWSCGDGGKVTLDVHPRGHFIPRGWIAQQIDELLTDASS